MALSQPTPAGLDPRLWEGPLPPMPSPFVRARSRALHEIAMSVLPRSILFGRGARHSGRKRVALTFDDGPDPMTPRYLDLLEELGVRATFFVIGEGMERARQAAEEYVRRGHEVGGHGWSHTPFTCMSPEGLADELSRMHDVLPRTTSARHVMVRPPRGSLSPRALLTLASAGYVTVLWSVDSDDCRTRDQHAIERRLAPGRLSPGDVVLMHEMQPWTLQALPRVVHGLRTAGFETVTVGELMAETDDGAV